jgi:hypothetical protein
LDKKAMTEPAETGTVEEIEPEDWPSPSEFMPEPVTEPEREAPTEPDPTSTATIETDASAEDSATSTADAWPGDTPDPTVLHRFRITHEKWLPGAINPTFSVTSEPYGIALAYEYLGGIGRAFDL